MRIDEAGQNERVGQVDEERIGIIDVTRNNVRDPAVLDNNALLQRRLTRPRQQPPCMHDGNITGAGRLRQQQAI